MNWTEKEIQILRREGKRRLPHELMLLLPGRTKVAIARKRKKLGIELPNSYFFKIGHYGQSKVNHDNCCKIDQSLRWNDLDKTTVQLLLGSLLGDGCVKKNSVKKGYGYSLRNFTFYEGHGAKQADYVKWKARLLASFYPCLNQDMMRPQFATASHPIFTELREKFYGKNKSKSFLPLDVLSQLDILGLLIWYLDDGTLGTPRPYLHIVSKDYNYRDLRKLVKLLNKSLSLSLYVKKYKHNSGWMKKVVFNAENRKKILPIWKRLFIEMEFPKCMEYKLGEKLPDLT